MPEDKKPIEDAFGQPRDSSTGAAIPPEAPKVEDKKPDDKAAEIKLDDIENNPVVKGLREEINKLNVDKGSMGTNLSEMRKVINKANDRIAELEKGGKPNIEPLFTDIKRVKDLSKEEQEAMTDTEKRLFDQLADTRDAMNKKVADDQKRQTDTEVATTEQQRAEQAKAEFVGRAQKAALAVADNDKEMANQILDKFNLFRDTDKLDDEELALRMKDAALLVPDFKPAKQPKSPQGSVVAAGTKEDPHGVDAIVQQAKGGATPGKYQL
jgi:hypothetical protein